MAHAGGAPSKLTAERIAEAEAYIFGRENSALNDATIALQKAAENSDIEEAEIVFDKLSQEQMGERDGDDLPTIEGLGLRLRVSRDTIYRWAEENDHFALMVELLMMKQSNQLQQRGVKGDYNSTIAKLLLTKHGYADKSETDNKHTGEVKVEVVNYAPDSTDETSDA